MRLGHAHHRLEVAHGDEGARRLLRDEDVLRIEVGDVARGYDVDVPDA